MTTAALKDVKAPIAIKNILLATDFATAANRAAPFSFSLVEQYGARLCVAHVIPKEVYALAQPESMERVLKETRDYATYELDKLVAPIRRRGRPCEVLVGEGNVSQVLTGFMRESDADLVIIGTSSRTGLGKAILGSVAEEIIRDAPCPVLTVGPHVLADARVGFRDIICATDFSPASLLAGELAVSLAYEYRAHLTLMHVLEAGSGASPHRATPLTEKLLRAMIPRDLELRYQPRVLVNDGSVADSILSCAAESSADLIAMGVRGAGAFAQTASRFGSIAHKVVSLAHCPVLTVGETWNPGDD